MKDDYIIKELALIYSEINKKINDLGRQRVLRCTINNLIKALEKLLEEYKKTVGDDNQRLEIYLSFKEVLQEQIKNFNDFGRIVSKTETFE